MNEQDPNFLAGIRPRTPEQDMRDALEKQEAARLNAEMAAKNAAYAERQLGDAYRAVSGKQPARPGDDAELLAAYNGGNEREQMAYAAGLREAERMQADLRLQQQNMLNSAVSHVDATTLANAMAGLSQEVEAMARYVGRLDDLVRSLLDSKSPFSEDDIAAIKAHVRHPGALEAAKLRETIRCALEALKMEQIGVAENILRGAVDAKG